MQHLQWSLFLGQFCTRTVWECGMHCGIINSCFCDTIYKSTKEPYWGFWGVSSKVKLNFPQIFVPPLVQWIFILKVVRLFPYKGKISSLTVKASWCVSKFLLIQWNIVISNVCVTLNYYPDSVSMPWLVYIAVLEFQVYGSFRPQMWPASQMWDQLQNA